MHPVTYPTADVENPTCLACRNDFIDYRKQSLQASLPKLIGVAGGLATVRGCKRHGHRHRFNPTGDLRYLMNYRGTDFSSSKCKNRVNATKATIPLVSTSCPSSLIVTAEEVIE
jgi:hypothetical protein